MEISEAHARSGGRRDEIIGRPSLRFFFFLPFRSSATLCELLAVRVLRERPPAAGRARSCSLVGWTHGGKDKAGEPEWTSAFPFFSLLFFFYPSFFMFIATG